MSHAVTGGHACDICGSVFKSEDVARLCEHVHDDDARARAQVEARVARLRAIAAKGGRAKKPGCQNNRFTPEQAREAQLRSAKVRTGKKFTKKKSPPKTDPWGMPLRRKKKP